MDIKAISSQNRKQINDFISSHWFSTDMVVRGKTIDMTKLDGFAVYENKAIIGLVTYEIDGSECEIVSLDSLSEKHGIGTALVEKVIETATKLKCVKIKLITTNDNLNAIRFYQRRGFDMTCLYHNSIQNARRIKPSIPMIGEYGIPIKHEIEFEMKLPKK